MSCEWTTREIAYLRESAGRVPLREIQLHLRRSAESVRKQAQSQGLSLRVPAYRRLGWSKWHVYGASRLHGLGDHVYDKREKPPIAP